jgi:putative ABC transport system permease protein
VWTHPAGAPQAHNPVSLPDFKDWQAQGRSFEAIAAYAFNRFLISGPQGSDQTRGIFVTEGFFPLFGVQPVLGRALLPSDEHERVVVLSHRLWHRRYGSDPGAIGRTIYLNDEAYTIVGVMPPSFRFPTPEIELWSSFASVYESSKNRVVGDWINSRGLRGYRVVARLNPGISVAQAQSESDPMADRIARAYPDTNTGVGISLVPLRDQILGNVRTPMLVLLGAVGFVLLIACANVADLMLARAAARGREISIRRALGASPARILRQMLTESLLLALCGGVLGLVLANWGVDALLRLSPPDIPRLEGVRIDASVLAFTFFASLVVGLLFGLAPAFTAWRTDLNRSLREAGGGAIGHSRGNRLRAALVVAEVSLAVVLLAGAGLMLRSFERLLSVDPGFPPDHLLTARMFGLGAKAEAPALIGYYDRVIERVRAIPGVLAAGAGTSLPPTLIQKGDSFTIEGRPAPDPSSSPSAIYIPITPDYLRALGVPLRSGRFFNAGDGAAASPVVLINDSLARAHFPGEDALGRRINVEGVSRIIVGVVGDAKYLGLHEPAGAQIFVPFAQSPFPGMYLVVRTSVDPVSLISAVRGAALEADPGHGPTNFLTMEDFISQSVSTPRFLTFLIGAFGATALLLAAVGVYGVIAYNVAQRTREIGIRVALGAQRSDVFRLIFRQGLLLVGAGLAIGLVGAAFATRAMRNLLFEIRPGDPATLAGAAAVLLGGAFLACFIPGRRAARVDPMIALRYE